MIRFTVAVRRSTEERNEKKKPWYLPSTHIWYFKMQTNKLVCSAI